MTDWNLLNRVKLLNGDILTSIIRSGKDEVYPFQRKCLRPVLEGKNVILQAPAGTGKTMVYALPALQRLDLGLKKLQVIIVAPTVSLVFQVRSCPRYRD